MECAGFDCPTVVKMIVSNFSGFRDEAIYKGEQVFFYKRAQILVADLIGAYDDYGYNHGKGKSNFKNKD